AARVADRGFGNGEHHTRLDLDGAAVRVDNACGATRVDENRVAGLELNRLVHGLVRATCAANQDTAPSYIKSRCLRCKAQQRGKTKSSGLLDAPDHEQLLVQ